MRRIISQILIVATFLFLAAFSAVWTEEDSDKPKSFQWIEDSVGQGWLFLDGLVKLASPSTAYLPDNISIDTEKIDEQIENMPTENLVESEMAGNFENYVQDVVSETPGRYLDFKTYSEAWRDFFSFGWLNLSNISK